MGLFGPPDIDKLKQKKDVKALIRALGNQSFLPDLRKQAADSLGALGDKCAVDPLIKALGDREYLVKKHAAMALGELRDPASFPALKSGFKDASGDFRKYVAAALVQVAGGSVPLLTELLVAFKFESAGIRGNVAAALVQLAGGSVPRLTELLGMWEMREETSSIIKALGASGNPAAVTPLTRIMMTSSWKEREEACLTLDALHWMPTEDEAGIWYHIVKKDWPQVVKAGATAVVPLCSAGWENEVTKEAAKALKKIGTPAVEPLLAILSEGTIGDAFAAEMLGALGDGRAIEPLLAAINGEDKELAIAAARSLVRLYKSRKITAQQKQLILGNRDLITGKKTYVDEPIPEQHKDFGGKLCAAHTDDTPRISKSVDFPL
jgi:HEAT repeat protein